MKLIFLFILILKAFIATGTNLQLVFNPCVNGLIEGCDFQKEPGKVKSIL